MKKTIFEEIGGTYIRHGDYLIPCLTLPEEEQRFIGVWGQRHKRYLKEHPEVSAEIDKIVRDTLVVEPEPFEDTVIARNEEDNE